MNGLVGKRSASIGHPVPATVPPVTATGGLSGALIPIGVVSTQVAPYALPNAVAAPPAAVIFSMSRRDSLFFDIGCSSEDGVRHGTRPGFCTRDATRNDV